MKDVPASVALERAAALIAEKGWTQGVTARDVTGCPVHSSSDRAVSFCVVGAVCLKGQPRVGEVHPAFAFIETVIGCSGVAGWNDEIERTKHDVVTALDAAYVVALQADGLEPEDVL